jgi:RNA polymerase-binding transcription factor DksA
MTSTQDDFDPRSALADLHRRTTRRLADLTGDHAGMVESSKDSNADDEHDPEGSTIAFERSQVSALVAEARHQLDEVEAALGRLDDGSYGTCEACGRPIPPARLVARTHVDCVG